MGIAKVFANLTRNQGSLRPKCGIFIEQREHTGAGKVQTPLAPGSFELHGAFFLSLSPSLTLPLSPSHSLHFFCV